MNKTRKFFILHQKIPVIGFDVPKLIPPVVVVARENPVVAVVDIFAASHWTSSSADIGVVLLVRFVKLGRLETVDMDVVVAVIPLPRPKPVPVTIVFGVPKVKPVIPDKNTKINVLKC